MAVRQLGKKGMFLTFISIAILAGFIIIFTPSDINLMKNIPVIKTRVSNVDEYVLDLENVYLERTLQATGRKTLIGLIEYMKVNGFFNDAEEFESIFSEVLLNGTIGKIPLDEIIDPFDNEPDIMTGNTYNDWLDRIKSTAQQTLNVDTTFNTIQAADILVYQINPWFVNVDANILFTVSTVEGTASWTKDFTITTEIEVENFDDPYYLVNTQGSYVNRINKTNTRFDEWNVEKVNDFITNGNYTHFINSDAPSFLMRFYDDMSASPCCGIESFVNPIHPAISDRDVSYVDHRYWSTTPSCPNTNLYTVAGLDSEFKLDFSHIIKYNLFSAASLKCPPPE